jgi:MoaA/NifB/PqqE/SkfB family radical SAM enzyme
VFKGHENMRDLTFFRKFPWVTVMLAPEKKFLKNFPRFPPYICLKNSYNLNLQEIDTVLQSNHIVFWEDDMYRIQRAIQKCYLPLTDCGAGKRKIAITLDGNVYPCADAAYHQMHCLGNIQKEPLDTILKKPRRSEKLSKKILKNVQKSAVLLIFAVAASLRRDAPKRKRYSTMYLKNS